MRPNRFFTDLYTSASIQWLTEVSQSRCGEDYFIKDIRRV
ncbi:hypothetical protein SAMN02745729_12153 [Marinobacterium iners DSM 11526]|uniref:Uncharacterized protein n=1 Tax=Marinobacterium iners DSM 11526 TaxID=1122198 RepID=A0A1H4GXU1_9GAMM|nr:hypothetical protein SAMN02745729_12153 [Marinobacterium iners DSM 11526]